MPIKNGWVTWAKRIPGIPEKVYSAPNTGEFLACHSVVGKESPTDDGVPNRFLDTSKDASGNFTDNAAASVQFVLRLDGTLIQMYPIDKSTWTSGGRVANCSSWSMEAEGGLADNPREKLTPEQVKTFLRWAGEWETWSGKKAVPGLTVFQHKEIAAKYGYAPTACASDRYSEAWAQLAGASPDQEDSLGMTPEERELLVNIATVLAGPATGKDLTLDEAVTHFRELAANDQLITLGLGLTQEKAGRVQAATSILAGVVEALTPGASSLTAAEYRSRLAEARALLEDGE